MNVFSMMPLTGSSAGRAMLHRPSPIVLAFRLRRLGIEGDVRSRRTTSAPPPATQANAPSPPSPPSSSVPSKFYVPRERRRGAHPESMYEIDGMYDRRIRRRRRIDPTRELNYTAAHWERHKSPYRRLKHVLTTFGSSPFQRLLFPDFLVSSLVAGGLTYYNEIVCGAASQQVWMDGSGFAAGTTAVAILTGFRLNASYGRYAEARRLMGAINTASRNLAANSMMWVVSQSGRERMLRLTKAFSAAVIFHLNCKGGHEIRRSDPNFDEQVYAEFRAEMTDAFLPPNEDDDLVRICRWFRDGENVPLGITSLMRQIIAGNVDQKDALNRELDVHVQTLARSVGGCERIQKTPIPTCFTRHTSRLLFAWSNLMPFVVYPVCGPYFTLPSTIAISYSIMGIEDIGVQLEEPFNILPLRQYSDGVSDGVDFVASAYSAKDAATS